MEFTQFLSTGLWRQEKLKKQLRNHPDGGGRMGTDDLSGKQTSQSKKYSFYSPSMLWGKACSFYFFFSPQPKMKKKFAFLILCLCKPKNILRLYSIPCSANVCIMFYCRLYFICTSEQTDGNSSGSGDSVYLCKPQILVSLAMLDISWVTTFFF